MSAARRAFVIMPFGKKKLPDGTEVDCDDVYKRLLAPAITAAGHLLALAVFGAAKVTRHGTGRWTIVD
jgi:hypothetical protein